MSNLPIPLAAFVAGLISFLSPCVLPLVPGYVSLISCAGIDELKTSSAALKRRVIINSLAFILGFSSVFITLGLAATGIGQALGQYRGVLAREAGVLIILFGLHMTGLVTIKALYSDVRLHSVKGNSTVWGSFAVGFAFAFGWTPCVGPILSVILGFASAEGSTLKGGLLLATYALGLAVPFLLTSLGIERFLKFYSRFKRHMHVTEVASGVLLIALGELLVFDRFTWISNQLSFLARFETWLEGVVTHNSAIAITVVVLVALFVLYAIFRPTRRPVASSQATLNSEGAAPRPADDEIAPALPASTDPPPQLAQKNHNPLALVVVAIVVAGMLFVGLHMARRGTEPPPMTQATPAPDFSLESLDGKITRLSDFRGKAVLLNFWATWCGPCKIEMPWFIDLQKEYGSQGLQIVGVAMDDASKEDIAKFAQDMGVNYPILIGKESVGDEYGGVPALPESFLIARDGKIVDKIIGLRGKAEIEDAVKKALETKPMANQASAAENALAVQAQN